jgi:hypothetical protein
MRTMFSKTEGSFLKGDRHVLARGQVTVKRGHKFHGAAIMNIPKTQKGSAGACVNQTPDKT